MLTDFCYNAVVIYAELTDEWTSRRFFMKIDKKTSKLVRKIYKHFLSHNIHLDLRLQTVVADSEEYIFRLKPKPGTRVDAIFDHVHDIKVALRLQLFEAFYDDNGDICLAVSKNANMQCSLIEMLKSREFRESEKPLLFALGSDLKGKKVFLDLAELPHILYGGSSYCGKSFGLICLGLSLAVKNPPDKLSLIIVDTGGRTMDVFQGLPHLSHPVVEDPETGVYVIRALVNEMERRNGLDDDELKEQPHIVCIIDELASFVMNAESKELVHNISDLLQRCRHNRIQMVLSAQNSTNEDTGVKFYNITTRVAFACANQQHSRNVLGEVGAEKITAKGMMLVSSRTFRNTIRLQGAYMEKEKVKKMVERINSTASDISNRFVIPEKSDTESVDKVSELLNSISSEDKEKEKELADIIMWAIAKEKVSASAIKEQFPMGNRAGYILNCLFEMGIVSEKFANQPRKVLVNSRSELSEDAVNLVTKCGYTVEQISNIFSRKSMALSSNQLIEDYSQDMPECEEYCEDE